MAIFEKSKDYEKLKKDVAIANKRIRKIENVYGEESWAINQLYDKIKDKELVNGINKNGLIRANKNMSEVQLRAIQKATREFLDSETSKLGGIKQAIRNVKKGLKGVLEDKDHPISNKDINKLYDLVKDKEKRDLTEQIGASTLWRATKHAKDKDLNFKRYYKNVSKRSDVVLKDENDVKFLQDLFEDYTGKKVSKKEIEEIISSFNLE